MAGVNADSHAEWFKACKENRTNVMRHAIMNEDIDIDIKNPSGATGLHLAAQAGAEDALRLLLESGADVTLRNSRGATALHYAGFQGRLKCIRCLIEEGGAKSDEVDHDGKTPVDYCLHLKRKEVVQALLHLRPSISSDVQRSRDAKERRAERNSLNRSTGSAHGKDRQARGGSGSGAGASSARQRGFGRYESEPAIRRQVGDQGVVGATSSSKGKGRFQDLSDLSGSGEGRDREYYGRGNVDNDNHIDNDVSASESDSRWHHAPASHRSPTAGASGHSRRERPTLRRIDEDDDSASVESSHRLRGRRGPRRSISVDDISQFMRYMERKEQVGRRRGKTTSNAGRRGRESSWSEGDDDGSPRLDRHHRSGPRSSSRRQRESPATSRRSRASRQAGSQRSHRSHRSGRSHGSRHRARDRLDRDSQRGGGRYSDSSRSVRSRSRSPVTDPESSGRYADDSFARQRYGNTGDHDREAVSTEDTQTNSGVDPRDHHNHHDHPHSHHHASRYTDRRDSGSGPDYSFVYNNHKVSAGEDSSSGPVQQRTRTGEPLYQFWGSGAERAAQRKRSDARRR